VSQRGQRLYDWWSHHSLAQRLLYGVAFFGRESTFRQRGVDALALQPGDHVLELGCGPGTNFARLRDAVGDDGRVVGVDYSPGMTEQARARIDGNGWENVHVLGGDAATLGIDAESFDAVYASMSLSAMPEPVAVLQEEDSVLRPDGRVAVLDARPYQQFPLTLLNLVLNPLFRLTTNWYPRNDVVDSLRAVFPEVSVQTFNASTIVVATAETTANQD
jgi:ubiquinone/menaquinone biosynthesis C-methylase UbiE